MKPAMYLDLEVYQNYFLAMFMSETGKVGYVDMHNDGVLDYDKLTRLVGMSATYYTFNGNGYDIPMLRYAMAGATTGQLKAASDMIIVNNTKPWTFAKMYTQADLDIDHVDLIEVAPGMTGLKTYAGRMHTQALEELPIDPSEWISDEQVIQLRQYCRKDLLNTRALRGELARQIDLRVALRNELVTELKAVKGAEMVFQVDDLRSKSDAQIAESVLKQGVFIATGAIPRKTNIKLQPFRCLVQDHIKFKSEELTTLLDDIRAAVFVVKETGHVEMPTKLVDRVVTIGGIGFKIGIGGLHSQEESVTRRAKPDEILRDIDVESYYPQLMLNVGLYPVATGPHFLKIYGDIKAQRVEAKHKMVAIYNEIQKLENELSSLQ